MKRLFDVTVAGAMVLLLLPLGLLIALVLALTGEHEVFYRQQRVGSDGRRFGLLKFVTMRKDSEKTGTGTVTVPGDSRVLPVGRWLRKAKLNELPQLLNVLICDMSLVGPRPLTPQTFAFYSPEVQRRIVTVPPGLTGLGSIVFRDEEGILAASALPAMECYRQEIAPYKGALELWYLEHRSLLLDLKLLVLTGLAVIAPSRRLHERFLEGIPRRPSNGSDS